MCHHFSLAALPEEWSTGVDEGLPWFQNDIAQALGVWGGLAQSWHLFLWVHSMWTLESSRNQAQNLWWLQGSWKSLESFYYLSPSDLSCFRVDLHLGEERKRKAFLGFSSYTTSYGAFLYWLWLKNNCHLLCFAGVLEASNWISCPPALLNRNLGLKYCYFCHDWEIRGCWAYFLTKHLIFFCFYKFISFFLL